MAAEVPVRRTKRLVVRGAATALVVVAVLAMVVAMGRDDDGLGEVRDLPSVATAEEASRGVEVVLDRGATASEVEAVLRDFPKRESGATRRGTVRLGDATLEVDGSSGRAITMAETLVAASAIATPDQTITVPSGGGARSLSATVKERSLAIPLARALVDALAPEGLWPGGIQGLFIQVPGGGRMPMPVTLGTFGSRLKAAKKALAVASDSMASDPVVSAGSAKVELRILAKDLVSARERWRATASALGSDAAGVDLYVDVMQRERPLGSTARAADGDLKRRPVLFGTASDDPADALALLTELDRSGTLLAAKTDGSFAQLTVDSYDKAKDAVADAEAASVEEFKLTWTAEPNGTDVADLPTVITDRPDVVRALLPGMQRASAVFGISWDRPQGVSRLGVSLHGPDAEAGRKLDTEVGRRRLMTRIRGIGWPGSATIRVPIGAGSCTGSSALATVLITSTASGKATDAEVGSACTERDDVSLVRADWNSAPRP